jgi:hypothetical protein
MLLNLDPDIVRSLNKTVRILRLHIHLTHLDIYQLWTVYEVNMLYMDLLGLY